MTRETYTLSNGYSVQTFGPNAEGDTEFTTINPKGEVIATTYHGRDATAQLHRDLIIAQELRGL